jgi:hypothetical protein
MTQRVINVASVPHRSPFRYPGGKTWLVPHVRLWMKSLGHRPFEFVEPFAGCAVVGWPIVLQRSMNMTKDSKLAELRRLQRRVDILREELGFSRPSETTFVATSDGTDDDTVVVEADGFGGATTSVVVGNYPVDYFTRFERHFPTEQEAEAAAEAVAFSGNSPNNVLGELS